MDKKVLVPVLSILLFSGILVIGLVLSIILRAPKPAVGQEAPEAIFTQAYQTIEAQFYSSTTEQALITQAVQQSATAIATLQSPTPTATGIVVNTRVPTATPTAISLNYTDVLCNQAQYIADITVPDNTKLQTNASFTKIWRIQNVGTCTWTEDYSMVFVSGSAMTNSTTVALPFSVAPGEFVDLSVHLIVPAGDGIYQGNWMLRSDTGVLFGIGPSADGAFWVQIQAVSSVAQMTLDPGIGYDFVTHACEAQWRSGAGNLACGTSSDVNGFIQILNGPILESKHENEPALWVHPNHAPDGWIAGTYPSYLVQDDDHFVAWIGCLDDNKGCKVTFQLNYVSNGKIKSLGAWDEQYDGSITRVDVDLSGLAGEEIQFVLYVEIDNEKYEKANAFWFVPEIINVEP